MTDTILKADRAALQLMLQVQPTLTAISNAGTTLQLANKELLHAGPPILDKQNMAQPIFNSALAAVLYEGWAKDIEEAKALVLSDEVTLTPAQDKNVAVPLADVLSASMSVLHVQDANKPNHVAYSTINGGMGPVTRVGIINQEVVDRLHWIYGPIAKTIGDLLEKQQPALLPIAEAAVLKGDDLHGATANSSALLFEALTKDLEKTDTQELAFIKDSAAFFLNVWMAACLCTLLAGQNQKHSSAIIRMGSNGKQFGFQVSALPGQWFTAEAEAPFIPDASAETQERSLGAIGDSAVVDAMGFGAMLTGYAPDTAARLQLALDQSKKPAPTGLLKTSHPNLTSIPDFRTGLCAQNVVELQVGPVVSLGVLDIKGEKGRLDGGFFFAPVAPFVAAVNAINKA